MEFVQYRTGKDDEGRRLDKVLRILFPETPLSSFYSALRKGLIRVNEKKIKQDYHITSGDVIFVADFLDFTARKPAADSAANRRASSALDVACLFKNAHILFLNKPYDIPVHETDSYSGMTLNQYVIKNFSSEDESLSFTPGPLHRLDRKTTGVIAFSQSITGAHIFTELLKSHEVSKHYLSVVDGDLAESLTFTDMLSKDESSDKAAGPAFHTVRIVPSDESAAQSGTVSACNAKKAVTSVRPLAHGSLNGHPVTFVEVQIETGRTHQIRSQCAHHGYPLTGDTAYGGSRYEGFFLHAYKLEIPQPNALGLPDAISAPLPERFSNFLEKYLPTVNVSLYTE